MRSQRDDGLVELLDDLGFAPRADERHRVVRLTRCPLLEAAHRYPDVVCGVHLGIVRAALEDYGTASDGAALHPFSEPGACRRTWSAGDGGSAGTTSWFPDPAVPRWCHGHDLADRPGPRPPRDREDGVQRMQLRHR